jgi:hypothetical protein
MSCREFHRWLRISTRVPYSAKQCHTVPHSAIQCHTVPHQYNKANTVVPKLVKKFLVFVENEISSPPSQKPTTYQCAPSQSVSSRYILILSPIYARSSKYRYKFRILLPFGRVHTLLAVIT